MAIEDHNIDTCIQKWLESKLKAIANSYTAEEYAKNKEIVTPSHVYNINKRLEKYMEYTWFSHYKVSL